MAAITLDNVDKKYGKVHAVRGISMDIADGEFVSFLGPSGCGKSSTMRMIAGLEEITGGDIRFDGESIINKKPGDRNVAMAFENYALYPTLNVYENIAFPLRSAGVEKSEIDSRVKEIAEVIGLSKLLEKRTAGLSSGQAQSVGLARALVRRPNVLLLDEPISHLDTSQRFQMRMYIKRLHIEFGYTMVLVTHDQEDALSMADRVAVMEMGKLHQIATPREIYDKPADVFVASFIGDIPMNFLECNVVGGENMRLQGDGFSLPMPAGIPAQNLNRNMLLGIRPYDLAVGAESDDAIRTEVLNVERLGDMNTLLVQCGEIKLQVVTSTDIIPGKSETIWLKPDMERATLFDSESQLALK